MPTKYWEPILGRWLISEPNPYTLSLTSEQWHRIKGLLLKGMPVTDYEMLVPQAGLLPATGIMSSLAEHP